MKPPLEADLHAYVDGGLPPDRREEVTAWLAAHADEAARVEAWRRQKEALHRAFDPVLEEPVPERLLRGGQGPGRWRVAAAVGWLGLGALLGYGLRGGEPAAPLAAAGLPRQAAVAHAVFVPEVRHPVEVGAEQEAHLAQWLSKRLGEPVRAPNLATVGFTLVGGRLLPAEQGPAAQFMYQDGGGRRVTLYLRRGARGEGETAFRYAREDGVGVFYWIDRQNGYALSGELPREELLSVGEAAYRDLERR